LVAVNFLALIIAVVGVAGTLLATLITQQIERRRMREQHDFELADEYMRWTRDRRADLYLRTTIHYLEAQNSLSETVSSMLKSFSLRDKAEAILAQATEKKAMVDRALASGAVVDKNTLQAELEQSDREMAEVNASVDRQNADTEGQKARLDTNYKRLNDELMELEIFGSRAVQSLASEVFAEIESTGRILVKTTKPGELDSKVLYKDLYEKWAQLLNAMRKELKVSD
jgi:hypothetical protein